MGYQIADTVGAARAGFEMGQGFMQPIVDALTERAHRKQAQQVMAQVQQELTELKAQGVTDHANYEELLLRMQAGEPLEGDELAIAGRKMMVSAVLYNQRASEAIRKHSMANPNNPILDKELGNLFADIQGGAAQAMNMGKMFQEEGMAEEEAEREQQRFDQTRADQNSQFDRSLAQQEKESDRSFSLQSAELAERRAERQESSAFRQRQEDRDTRRLGMEERAEDFRLAEQEREGFRRDEEHQMTTEAHGVAMAKAKREANLGGISDTLELRELRETLTKDGADESVVDQFLLDNGVSREEIDRITKMGETEIETSAEAAEGLPEAQMKKVKEKQTKLKRIEEHIEDQQSRSKPDKARLSLLREERDELKARIREELDEAADSELKGRKFKRALNTAVGRFKDFVRGSEDPMKMTNQPEPTMSTELE
jgi:hypothetical protein